GLAWLPREIYQLAKLKNVSAPDLETIRRLWRLKLDELRDTIALRKNGFEPAAAVIRAGSGKETMDQLRLALTTLQAQQENALRAETQVADQATRVRTLTFVVVGLVNLLFLSWAYRRIQAAVR